MTTNYLSETLQRNPLECLIVAQIESLRAAEAKLRSRFSQLSQPELKMDAANEFASELHSLDLRAERLDRMINAVSCY